MQRNRKSREHQTQSSTSWRRSVFGINKRSLIPVDRFLWQNVITKYVTSFSTNVTVYNKILSSQFNLLPQIKTSAKKKNNNRLFIKPDENKIKSSTSWRRSVFGINKRSLIPVDRFLWQNVITKYVTSFSTNNISKIIEASVKTLILYRNGSKVTILVSDLIYK
jgi:putative SOS response-associated peptidase YedK